MSLPSSPGIASRRSALRAGASILGIATLALVAFAPNAASADSSGTVAISALVCATEAAAETPENCDPAPAGDVHIVSEDGVLVLTAADASVHGATTVWGESGDLPLGLYFIDFDGLQIPAGYQIWNGVAVMGDTGGSEIGWYANLSDVQPNAQLDVVLTPAGDTGDVIDGGDADGDGVSDLDEINVYGTDPNNPDSDGDGAPDYAEIWAGSDPLDDQDWPSVQAGPDNGPSAGPSDADDSDGDRACDLTESLAGTDPYDASSFPAVQAGPELGSDFDTDGDGAEDIIETAYGSDPNDPTDHPRPTSAEGTSPAVTQPAVAQPAVTQLPNTGSGATATTDTTVLAALLGVGALAFAGAGVTAQRRKA